MDKLYPIGIQSFGEIRKGGYIYIDKTRLIYNLSHSGKYYFLSRPRRFGKSLLLSTLEAYFLGKKGLFKDLAMEKLESEWAEHTVFHLDLNSEKYDSKERLDGVLHDALCKWEDKYGKRESETSFSLRFQGIIQRAAQKAGRNVVILIDEYDKPMLQAIGNPELQTEFRNTLKAFYGVLKSCDAYIRFAMLTGVTKFGKVSVFSDLNNLMDISMLNKYATICGITNDELFEYFDEDIHQLSKALGLNYHETCDKLKLYYDGYHFSYKSTGIYNPFSLLNTFANMQLGNYWFETGTPTYLVELMKQHNYAVSEIEHIVTSGPVLDCIDAASTDPVPIIYQSGYLTIQDYNEEFGNYTLGFPNREVEQGFMKFILPYYASVSVSKSSYEIQCFVNDVRRGHVDDFLSRLQTFFDDTPYELVREREIHYQNILYIVFKLMGFHTEVEYRTSHGRVDLVLKTSGYIYIMEFKLNGSAEEAISQINAKGYAQPFAKDGRKVIKVGINFSDKTRSIDKWIIE